MLKIVSSEKYSALTSLNRTLALDREAMAERVNQVYARLASAECNRLEMEHRIDMLVTENQRLLRQLQIAVADFLAQQEIARFPDKLYTEYQKRV